MLVVDLVKKQPFILRIAFERVDFNFSCIFGFLESELTFDKLRALEEIFIPFCKKYPEKVWISWVDSRDVEEKSEDQRDFAE